MMRFFTGLQHGTASGGVSLKKTSSYRNIIIKLGVKGQAKYLLYNTMSTSLGDALLFCTQLLGVALIQENLSIGIRKIDFPYSNTKVLTKKFEL